MIFNKIARKINQKIDSRKNRRKKRRKIDIFLGHFLAPQGKIFQQAFAYNIESSHYHPPKNSQKNRKTQNLGGVGSVQTTPVYVFDRIPKTGAFF